MKKTLKIILIFMFCFLFVFTIGCGDDDSNNNENDDETKDPGDNEKEDDPEKPVETVYLKSISLTSEKVKTKYVLGESLDLSNLVVTATYSDNTTKEIKDDYVVDSSGFKEKIGNYRIVIKYTEKDRFATAILEVKVVSILDTMKYLIGIDVQPRKDYFNVGEEFNTNNLVVMAIYSDESKENVTEKVTINSIKYNKDLVGTYEIIIDYKETYGEGKNAIEIAWDSFYFAVVKEAEGE